MKRALRNCSCPGNRSRSEYFASESETQCVSTRLHGVITLGRDVIDYPRQWATEAAIETCLNVLTNGNVLNVDSSRYERKIWEERRHNQKQYQSAHSERGSNRRIMSLRSSTD